VQAAAYIASCRTTCVQLGQDEVVSGNIYVTGRHTSNALHMVHWTLVCLRPPVASHGREHCINGCVD